MGVSYDFFSRSGTPSNYFDEDKKWDWHFHIYGYERPRKVETFRQKEKAKEVKSHISSYDGTLINTLKTESSKFWLQIESLYFMSL